MNLTRMFRAGRVTRWHSNPDMAHTVDPIDGHSGRVARIIAMLHPEPSAALLIEALRHDDGEVLVGDMDGMLKAQRPDFAAALEDLERSERLAIWGSTFDLSADDAQWLKFADRLDAYMWALHHEPHVLSGDGWPEAYDRIIGRALVLGGAEMAAQVGVALNHGQGARK